MLKYVPNGAKNEFAHPPAADAKTLSSILAGAGRLGEGGAVRRGRICSSCRNARFYTAGRPRGPRGGRESGPPPDACTGTRSVVWDWQDSNLRPLVPKTRIMPS